MLTFTDQQNIAKNLAGVSDAGSVITFKRDINVGGTRFMAILGRSWNRVSRFTNQVALQQYYQIPQDALRVSDVIFYTGSVWQPLLEIADENQWRLMNQTPINGIASHYFIKGNDEIGLYPAPSGTVTNGIELVFEPRNVLMTEDDFTTGSVTVTNGSTTITHSATGFTAKMVGQYFQVNDGTDGNWYRISAYIDASNLTLENYYQGISEGGATFRIGQVMNMPEEFQEAPVDYAIHRYYLMRGDRQQATDFRNLFESSLEACRDLYGTSSSNQIVMAENNIHVYNPLLDTPPTIGS